MIAAKKSNKSTAKKSNQSTGKNDSISKQLNEKEIWKPKKKSARSYLAPVKNWNVDKKVQDRPKISLLTNANLSTTVHTVAKRKVALRNTCASDSICQVKLCFFF